MSLFSLKARDKQKQSFHPLVNATKAHNSQSCARQKPGIPLQSPLRNLENIFQNAQYNGTVSEVEGELDPSHCIIGGECK